MTYKIIQNCRPPLIRPADASLSVERGKHHYESADRSSRVKSSQIEITHCPQSIFFAASSLYCKLLIKDLNIKHNILQLEELKKIYKQIKKRLRLGITNQYLIMFASHFETAGPLWTSYCVGPSHSWEQHICQFEN